MTPRPGSRLMAGLSRFMRLRHSVRTLPLAISVLVLAGSLGLAIAAVSQSPLQWTLTGAATTADLKGLAVADATTAYAVGSSGTVLSTRDGGTTWDVFPTETTLTLNAIDAPAVGSAWTVGEQGTVLGLDESGAWVAEPSTVSTDLLGVDFADRTHGWAVGAAGTIISTADGGATWTTQTAGVPEAVALRGVRFLNELTGWAWGDRGTVIRTNDGGATWSVAAATSEDIDLFSGSFVDTQTGWVAGSGGVVRATADGGATWTTQTIDSTGTVNGVTFADALRGFAVGGDDAGAFVRKTIDGGMTWTTEPVEATSTLRAIGLADAEHGWAVGDAGLLLAASPAVVPTPPIAVVELPSTAPSAPVAVLSRALRDNQVVVAWQESADTTGPVSYNIWRSVSGEPYALLDTITAADGNSYTDQTAPAGTVVAYQISAIDQRGEGVRSEPTGVTTPELPVASGPAQGTMTCQGCHPAHGRLEPSTALAADRSCFDCHQTDIGADLSGADPSTRHDLLATDQASTGARLACSNCHQPHVTTETTPVVDPDLPGTASGLANGTNAFCLKCHDGGLPTETAPWVASPLANGGVSTTANIGATFGTGFHGGGTASAAHLRPGMGYAAGDTLACVTCHDPHGSINRSTLRSAVPSKDGSSTAAGLLVRSLPDGGADFRLFCAGCHSLAAHPTGPGGADLNVWPIDCTTCHSHAGGL